MQISPLRNRSLSTDRNSPTYPPILIFIQNQQIINYSKINKRPRNRLTLHEPAPPVQHTTALNGNCKQNDHNHPPADPILPSTPNLDNSTKITGITQKELTSASNNQWKINL